MNDTLTEIIAAYLPKAKAGDIEAAELVLKAVELQCRAPRAVMAGPGPMPSGGGAISARIADSVIVTIASPESPPELQDYVILVLEEVTRDPDNPIRNVVYRADPDQADMIADRLKKYAQTIRERTT